MDEIKTLVDQAQAFREHAHSILGIHEASKSRVVLLEDTYDKLGALSLKQDELFRQALRCVENSLFRAAHVMAWAGFSDFLEEKLASDGFRKLHAARLSWKFKTVEDLRETRTDHAIIEASKDAALCAKSEMKALLGLLSKRNECAHPGNYFPGLNETLGYISELFQRIETLRARRY
jgi:hypothetical protein